MRAILSVSDKTGLAALGRELASRGVELVSTGGSAKSLDAPSMVEIAPRPLTKIAATPDNDPPTDIAAE